MHRHLLTCGALYCDNFHVREQCSEIICGLWILCKGVSSRGVRSEWVVWWCGEASGYFCWQWRCVRLRAHTSDMSSTRGRESFRLAEALRINAAMRDVGMSEMACVGLASVSLSPRRM